MIGSIEKRYEVGSDFVNTILPLLRKIFPENAFSFEINPRTMDGIEGDILVYYANSFVCGIDCKAGCIVSLRSIAIFMGKNNRALFLSPYHVTVCSINFKLYVFGKIYQMFPEHNLNRMKFETLAEFITAYYHDKLLPENSIFVKMPSGDIGVDFFKIDPAYIMINGDWKDYDDLLRRYFKGKI